jgi:alanyl aminopeptidase
VLPPFARSRDRLIVEASMDIVQRLREMVTAAEWPRYEALVQRLYGDRARELGWTPRPDDDADTRLLRSKLVAFVADEGGDAGLRAAAAKLADQWLADPKAVDAEVSGSVLWAAARKGDAQLFDRYLAAAKQSKDRLDRGKLLSALGRFRDPALIDRALDLVLSGDFDIRETQGLLRGINAEPAGRERSFAWLERNYDQFAKVIPHQMLGRLPFYTANFCDDAHRDAVAAFFKEKNIDQYDGGARTLAQALEGIHLCAAYRGAQAPSMDAYLAVN